MFSKRSLVLCVYNQVRKLITNGVGVLGVPFSKGQPRTGTELAPKVLRDSGLITELNEYLPNLIIKDYGDIKYELQDNINTSNLKNWSHVTKCNQQLSNSVMKILKDDHVCLSLGGDHSIGVGSVDGHFRALGNTGLSLLWIDAHADINTCNSTPSGNCHGMPVSLLVKELHHHWNSIPGLEWLKPKLSLRNIAYIGLRAVDAFERDVINQYGVQAYSMDDIDKYGIHNIIKMALDHIDPDGNRSLHVSFDIDSLDVLEAPSTGTPVRGGLTLREGMEIMETVYKTNRMKVLDIVEVNPSLGTVSDVNKTVEAAKHIILSGFGYKRSGSINVQDH